MTPDDRTPPPGTGEHLTTRAEDVATGEDEPGHHDGDSSGADRPAGGSSARAYTSVDPQDPVDPAMPRFPAP